MKRLGIEDCRTLALRILPRLCKEGLVDPFRSWRSPAAPSLLQALKEGCAFQDALKRMSPRLPQVLEELLLLGLQLRMIDYLAEDIRQAYRSPRGLKTRLDALLRKWRTGNPSVVCINGSCLEREVGKILRRARAEKASEVVLKADGEQVYLGVKPVRVIEGGMAGVHAALKLDHRGRHSTLRQGGSSVRLTFAS